MIAGTPHDHQKRCPKSLIYPHYGVGMEQWTHKLSAALFISMGAVQKQLLLDRYYE